MTVDLPLEVVYEKRGRVAYVRINRPDKLNAVTHEMIAGINQAFADFQADPELYVAILTGTGEKAFCAGADLGRTAAVSRLGEPGVAPPDISTARPFKDVFKPIIAAVNGLCTANGFEMLQGTDIRVAADHATFGLGEVKWGLIPRAGSHVRLPRQIPWAIAMEIILVGRFISAQQALDWGVVNRVVPANEVMKTAEEFAETIASNGPYAVRTAKEVALRTRNMDWDEAFALETLYADRVMSGHDAKEGPRAFMEKRKPEWKGF